ncbi:hypothetical protein [Arthrobacter sp. AL12]|uniref:hypothetical protein n=1 Tax=Arthrobacter sp. AL12 TaxID=3042241 RepID=UPI00249CED63|nr:hypothetical protein [Arthrobacter sp. AL12]MDI3214029.1 hypothetical protein [Arthrobacter sp. AL12]
MDPDIDSTNGTADRVFSDDGVGPGSSAAVAPRRRWPWITAILALAVAAGTAGVLVAGNLASAPEQAGPAGGTTAPSASASLSAPPTGATGAAASASPVIPQDAATSPATQGTVAGPAPGRYSSSAAGVSFDLPAGWTAEESTVGAGGNPGTRVIIFNEARMQVAELYHGAAGGVGGACGPGPYPMAELDTAPALGSQWATAAGVRFSYRVLDMRADGGAFDYQIGLVDNLSGQLKDSCLMYSFAAGAPQGTLSFANRAAQSPAHDDPVFNSLAEAKAYLLAPEYRKLKGMILSLEMRD